ncbi:serine O-acetyltransferase [Bifidobacterium adolescentis]|uniref:serine O-acetyltransferase n=1 Tax=Bifidobacterium adolescentis TaxID=1680 RepID=UPI0011C22B27|nr:serine acetyltransferase [Bifidobacterium adolescentis]
MKNIIKCLFIRQVRAETYCKIISRCNRNGVLKKLAIWRLATAYHILISPETKILGRIILPHPQNIVLGRGVVVEDNVTIYQDVTVGVRSFDEAKGFAAPRYPVLCSGTCIFAGAKIIGGIRVGNKAIVGCNAVVTHDVEDRTVVAGVPAKYIRKIVER